MKCTNNLWRGLWWQRNHSWGMLNPQFLKPIHVRSSKPCDPTFIFLAGKSRQMTLSDTPRTYSISPTLVSSQPTIWRCVLIFKKSSTNSSHHRGTLTPLSAPSHPLTHKRDMSPFGSIEPHGFAYAIPTPPRGPSTRSTSASSRDGCAKWSGSLEEVRGKWVWCASVWGGSTHDSVSPSHFIPKTTTSHDLRAARHPVPSIHRHRLPTTNFPPPSTYPPR